MRPTTIFLLAALLTTVAYAETSTFGEPLDPDLETTEIASIVADPDAWKGRTVRVEGTVDGVCSMQGCWMDLEAADGTSLRVKVDDGVIVFPDRAIGHDATAEGKVQIIDMERDRYVAWMRHVADEEGRDFDPETIGDGPYRIVQLYGTGAEIDLPARESSR